MRTKNKWALFLVACVVYIGERKVVGRHHRGNDGNVEWNRSSTFDDGYKRTPVPFRTEDKSEFPDDLFTEEQLKRGALVLHFLGALYSFAMIGIVCGDYFLPSVDCICLGLNLSQDVAAATFMSFATTAPELFTVLIGTFIKESDSGLGAVIGSGMFNILGVATFGGLAAIRPIQLDWWPLVRDSSIYILSLTALVIVIYDRTVSVTEASFLIACYFIYFFLMLYNQSCRKLVTTCIDRFQVGKRSKSSKATNEPSRAIPELRVQSDLPPVVFVEEEALEEDVSNIKDNTSYKAYFINHDRRSLSRKSIRSEKGSFVGKVGSESEKEIQSAHLEVPVGVENPRPLPEWFSDHHVLQNEVQVWTVQKSDASIKSSVEEKEEEEEEFTGMDLMHIPEGSFSDVALWFFLWPGYFLLFLTVPDCRIVKWRKYYPLTFVMCVIWIGITSYFGNWMITVIGDIIGIPDSVMGLTFLAAGGSMPEAFSTLIMARRGEGGLGFSNSLGGNTMDICLCLGLPWLLKCALSGPIIFDSESLHYNTIALFIGIFILIGVSLHTGFKMNRKMGLICGLCYLIFIAVSLLFELGVVSS